MPGMPPGAPPPGGDPMAALAGAGAGQPGQPPADGQPQPGAEPSPAQPQPPGDFLDALRHFREGEASQYARQQIDESVAKIESALRHTPGLPSPDVRQALLAVQYLRQKGREDLARQWLERVPLQFGGWQPGTTGDGE